MGYVVADSRLPPAMAKKGTALLVAVVEDDAGVRKATERLLRAAGFAVQGFSSAEDFLRSRPALRAACLLLDVRLPGMSGLELQTHLRELGVCIPTVVLTGNLDVDGRIRARAAKNGAVAFLQKPVDEHALTRAVRLAAAGEK